MKTPVAIAAVLGVFLMGGLIGVVGTHLHKSHSMPWERHQPQHSRTPAHGTPPFLHGLEDELHLSRGQLHELHEILVESRHEAEAIRHEVAPRVHEHLEATHQRLLLILTPEQRARLLELHPPYWRDRDPDELGPHAREDHPPGH